MPESSNLEISLFVPESLPAPPVLPLDQAEQHSLKGVVGAFRGVTRVSMESVQSQWNSTIDTLVGLTSTIAAKAQDWEIDEIEVGLTLSAKGELLFIAEAGAEASIKVVLKPRKHSLG